MSDIESIQQRIAQIRKEISENPGLRRQIETQYDRDHQFLHDAEKHMHESRKVVPLKGRRIRRPDDGEEIDL